jgi:hypothetical protein
MPATQQASELAAPSSSALHADGDVTRIVTSRGRVLLVATFPDAWIVADPADELGNLSWYVRTAPEREAVPCAPSLSGDEGDVRTQPIQPDARADRDRCGIELHRSILFRLASAGSVTGEVRGSRFTLTAGQHTTLKAFATRLQDEIAASAAPTPSTPAPSAASPEAPSTPSP